MKKIYISLINVFVFSCVWLRAAAKSNIFPVC